METAHCRLPCSPPGHPAALLSPARSALGSSAFAITSPGSAFPGLTAWNQLYRHNVLISTDVLFLDPPGCWCCDCSWCEKQLNSVRCQLWKWTLLWPSLQDPDNRLGPEPHTGFPPNLKYLQLLPTGWNTRWKGHRTEKVLAPTACWGWFLSHLLSRMGNH